MAGERLAEAGFALQNVHQIVFYQGDQLGNGELSELDALSIGENVTVFIKVSHGSSGHDGRLPVVKSQPSSNGNSQLQYSIGVKRLIWIQPAIARH